MRKDIPFPPEEERVLAVENFILSPRRPKDDYDIVLITIKITFILSVIYNFERHNKEEEDFET